MPRPRITPSEWFWSAFGAIPALAATMLVLGGLAAAASRPLDAWEAAIYGGITGIAGVHAALCSLGIRATRLRRTVRLVAATALVTAVAMVAYTPFAAPPSETRNEDLAGP